MFCMQNKLYFDNITLHEQDYLKAIFHLTFESGLKEVGTNALAEKLSLSPGSVNLMVKKLKSKTLVDYEKYGKISLTEKGKKIALSLIRKHRIWETFLYQKLNFKWEEVHQIAEQLEHIESDLLVERLEEFMNFPEFDPHGSKIPKMNQEYTIINHLKLTECELGTKVKVIAINDNNVDLLKYATSIGIQIGTTILIKEFRSFDKSLLVMIDSKEFQITNTFASNVFCK